MTVLELFIDGMGCRRCIREAKPHCEMYQGCSPSASQGSPGRRWGLARVHVASALTGPGANERSGAVSASHG